MAKVGYVRVSSTDQNTARQDIMLTDCEKVFTEKVSGKDTENRPQLAKLMEFIRAGDTVIVESYSRFARDAYLYRAGGV